MTARYVLASAAEADLRDIVRHARKVWGVAQARTYAAFVVALGDPLEAGPKLRALLSRIPAWDA